MLPPFVVVIVVLVNVHERPEMKIKKNYSTHTAGFNLFDSFKENENNIERKPKNTATEQKLFQFFFFFFFHSLNFNFSSSMRCALVVVSRMDFFRPSICLVRMCAFVMVWSVGPGRVGEVK